jgi:hypothetical protein
MAIPHMALKNDEKRAITPSFISKTIRDRC